MTGESRRVLSYIPGATFGGAHNQALRLAKALRLQGYEVVVLLPDEPGDAGERLRACDIEVHTAPLNRLRATRSIREHWSLARGGIQQVSLLTRLIRTLDIDLVQVHGITCLDGAIAARKEHKPLVWQLIDSRAPLLLRALLVPYVRGSHATVMTTGTTIQTAFPGLRHLDAGRLVPFYPPVDIEEFNGEEVRRSRARLVLGIADNTRLVVCLANLNPQKGIEGLLRACARAIADGARFAVRIRGSESFAHPGYRGILEALAAHLGLGANCIGTMETELSSADFLSAGDVFALASRSRSEGVPTALLEAMSSKLPVIATMVGGIAEVMSETYGVVVPPGDDEALASALLSATDWPEWQRKALGQSGRAFVESKANLACCVQAHLSAYSRAMIEVEH